MKNFSRSLKRDIRGLKEALYEKNWTARCVRGFAACGPRALQPKGELCSGRVCACILRTYKDTDSHSKENRYA